MYGDVIGAVQVHCWNVLIQGVHCFDWLMEELNEFDWQIWTDVIFDWLFRYIIGTGSKIKYEKEKKQIVRI